PPLPRAGDPQRHSAGHFGRRTRRPAARLQSADGWGPKLKVRQAGVGVAEITGKDRRLARITKTDGGRGGQTGGCLGRCFVPGNFTPRLNPAQSKSRVQFWAGWRGGSERGLEPARWHARGAE